MDQQYPKHCFCLSNFKWGSWEKDQMQMWSQIGGSYFPTSICYCCRTPANFDQSSLHNGHINTPIEQSASMSYPIIQYADDTLIIMPADPHQISYAMEILQTFSDFIGLQVNYHRSSLVPINISDDKANQPATILGSKKRKHAFHLSGTANGLHQTQS